MSRQLTSKEAPDANVCPPPRPTKTPRPAATVVPLEQLWNQLPIAKRQELLRHLTRILAQRLAPPSSKEEADE